MPVPALAACPTGGREKAAASGDEESRNVGELVSVVVQGRKAWKSSGSALDAADDQAGIKGWPVIITVRGPQYQRK